MSGIYDDKYGLSIAGRAFVREFERAEDARAEVRRLRDELEDERHHADRLAEALDAALPAPGFAEEFTARGDDWFYLLGRDVLDDHLKRRGS